MAETGDFETTDLFLIGKTGHGKSTTGNAILGRVAFNESCNTESETYGIQSGYARRLGRQLKVVDGPGLSETRMNKGDSAKKMVEDMREGVAQCPLGFHAMLLVLKYGNRFTEEELGTIESLKAVFGETFVRDFCILIFTHGDNFDTHQKRNKTNLNFKDWCQQQRGPIENLFAECEQRAILFYNMNKEKEEQLGQLLNMVDGLKSRGKRYTNDTFKKVAKEREMLIVRENAPIIREEIQLKIDLLIDGLNSFKGCTELDELTKARLSLLKKDARDLDNEINRRDKNTGVLDQLRQVVAKLTENIESHAEFMAAKLDGKQKEQEMARMSQEHNEAIKREQIERQQREQELEKEREEHERVIKQKNLDQEQMKRELREAEEMYEKALEQHRLENKRKDQEMENVRKQHLAAIEEQKRQLGQVDQAMNDMKAQHEKAIADLRRQQPKRSFWSTFKQVCTCVLSIIPITRPIAVGIVVADAIANTVEQAKK